MRQKLVRIQISHQELLRKMLYFHKYSTSSFNNSIYQSEFQSIFKLANITSVFKKVTQILIKIIDQSAYSQKSLKDGCNIKFPSSWIPICQSNNVGLEKVTVHSIACSQC